MRMDFLKKAATVLTTEEIRGLVENRKASVPATVEIKNLDTEKRTLTVSVSSETPVKRWYGREILDHTDKSVDLGRFRDGAALLWNHDSSRQIGVVEAVRNEGKKLEVDLRFSRSEFAEEKLQDVADGIVRNVSIRYLIEKIRLQEKTKKESVWRVMRWEPVEVSFAPVPADPAVGVGRSLEDKGLEEAVRGLLENKDTKNFSERSSMDEEEEEQTGTGGTDTQNPPPAAPRAREGVDNYREYLADMAAVADTLAARDLIADAVARNLKPQEFATEVVNKRSSNTPAPTVDKSPLGLSQEDVRNFSFRKVIHAQLTGKWDGAEHERDICMAAAKQRNSDDEGVMIPIDVLRDEEARYNTSANTEALVFTTHRPQDFISLLRNNMAVAGLGARVINGLRGEINIPRQSGGVKAQWVDEEEDSKEEDVPFDQVNLKPRTLTAHAGWSKKLLAQNTMDVENLIRADLAQAMALAADFAAIGGKGGKQPQGIIGHPDIKKKDVAALGWKEVVELETNIDAANANIGSLAYLTNAKIRGMLKTTQKAENTGIFIWDKNNSMNGYKAQVSNQIPVVGNGNAKKTYLLYGNWADLIIGYFSGLDVVVDPYTLAQKRRVRVVFSQETDVALRHPESFSYHEGIKVS